MRKMETTTPMMGPAAPPPPPPGSASGRLFVVVLLASLWRPVDGGARDEGMGGVTAGEGGGGAPPGGKGGRLGVSRVSASTKVATSLWVSAPSPAPPACPMQTVSVSTNQRAVVRDGCGRARGRERASVWR